MNNYGKSTKGPEASAPAACSFSYLSSALKHKYGVLTVERDTDPSFSVPTVSKFRGLIASGELLEKYDFGPLLHLAQAALDGTAPLEGIGQSLKDYPAPRRAGWKPLCSEIDHRISTTRPSRRQAAALLCLFLASQWLMGKSEHSRRGINHAHLVPSKEKNRDTGESVVKYHAADHLALRSEMTRSPRVDHVATFRTDVADMEQMVARMWRESIAPDCESGHLPQFYIKY